MSEEKKVELDIPKKKDAFRMLGEQYYRFLEDESVEQIRVVSVKNLNEIKIMNSNGDIEKVNPSDILEKYILLEPDGLITVAEVGMGKDSKGYNVNDVVVCLYRSSEMNIGNYEPFAVCRQNITDFFANYFSESPNGTNLVGVSVSKDSCPENISFELVRSCVDIKTCVSINIYIEDTIDSILAMCGNKLKGFDRTLKSLYEDHYKSFPHLQWGASKNLHDKGEAIDGYCTSLKDLLTLNNFMYDFNSGYNILEINTDIEEEKILVEDDIFGKYYTLPTDITVELSKVFKQNISDTIVVQYTHEIAIEDLAGTKYFMIRDKNNMIYIINYTTSGEYRESDLEVIAAKDAMEKAKSLFSFVGNKYKKS